MFLHLVAQGVASDAQASRGFGLIAVRTFERRKRPKWAAVIICRRGEIEEGVRSGSDFGYACRSKCLSILRP